MCWRVEDWMGLLKALDRSGLLRWVAEDEVPHVAGARCGAGLLGAPKKSGDALRLIIDRRRANSLEVPLFVALERAVAASGLSFETASEVVREFSLPAASQFCDMYLGPSQTFDIFLEDGRKAGQG